MSPEADLTYFCKRCRATQVKRCRCPLPTIGTDHNWDADAAYHLWPNALEELVGAATNWDGTPITLRDLLQRTRK